ncbi:hypothetical protein VaNZ11_000640 [Volvox africanus]|uniref:DEK-C domain-containing protein n=1 Tax=Volvox africanus TaxID=51714 RepID=A0ABQ5RN67_9CHLO|nr:hypothetical protein VaNZ11_000640 [Volvox africanus]
MADDRSGSEAVIEEDHKQLEDKSATARKKSLGGLDSSSVLSGPRQRKKAEHFQVEVKEKADFVIKAGKGTKLGDIPNVHYLLGKLKTDDELLTSLHNLLFKRPGTAHRRKRNLYEFSGMTFDDGEKDKELEKLQERLSKWTIPLLNGALDVFELPRGNGDEGKKEAKVERLIKFLDEPKKLSEKDLAAQDAKKKDAAKAKKEKEQKNKTPKSAAKGGRKLEGGQESSKKKRSRKAESGEEAEEEAEEEPSEEAEEAAPEPEEQPKKRAKKENVGASKKSAEKKTPASRKSTGKKRKADEEEVVAEVPSAEGAEEANSNAKLPDDEAIKEATLELLTVSDVSKTTVKDVLKQLKEKFGTDLSKKRAFVKGIAVEYAKTKVPVSEEAGDPAEEAAAEDATPSDKKQKCEDDADEASPAVAAVDTEAADPEEDQAEPEAEAVDEEPETKEADAEAEAKEEEAKEDKAESVQAKSEDDGAHDPTGNATETGKPQEEVVVDNTTANVEVDEKAVEVTESKD